jgi:glycosyltransferase involved in cell wall biosynthesis
MPRIAASLDISAVSSAYGEAFPLVVGEAMACGVPCVVTDIGDSRFLVGNTGRVVPPKDPQALADAWHKLIEMGPDGRGRLGQLARQRIMERFDLGMIAARYASVYSEVAQGRNV